MTLTTQDKQDIKQIVGTAIDELAAVTKQGFDNVDQRFNRLEGRMDSLEGRMSGIESELADFKQEVRQRLDKIDADILR